MSLKASIIRGLLLVIPFNPELLLKDSCLSNNFFGNYGDGQSTYSILTIPNPETLSDCMTFWESRFTSAHYASTPIEGRQLVWLEEKAVDETLKLHASHEDDLELLLSGFPAPIGLERQQEVIATSQGHVDYSAFEVHYRTATAALVSVTAEHAKIIDTLLPPFWKSTLLPATPVSYLPVPPSAVRRVSEILSTLKFNPVVASVVNNISVPQIQQDIRFLTGEDETSPILSRHSFSEGARTAAEWLKARIEETGAECRLTSFMPVFAPNVIWFVQK